jgi:hypothetical protein
MPLKCTSGTAHRVDQTHGDWLDADCALVGNRKNVELAGDNLWQGALVTLDIHVHRNDGMWMLCMLIVRDQQLQTWAMSPFALLS